MAGKPKAGSGGKAIAKAPSKGITKSEKSFTIASLEEALLKKFPKADAEPWDVMGLTVGEVGLPVKGVAVALDPTVDAIRKAGHLGASVLITHHPPFIEPPAVFGPADSIAQNPGAGVWAAIQNKVALMNFHTALDVSKDAQKMLPSLMGLKMTGSVLEPIDSSEKKGYGQVCTVPKSGNKPESLGRLAAKATSVFGRAPRVWGNFDLQVTRAVCCLGSCGNLGHAALMSNADVLICGEIKYHDALELSGAGLGIIELGHDTSELPLTAVIVKALADVGVGKGDITVIDQSKNWQYPETIRL